jgi:hypothetical protein
MNKNELANLLAQKDLPARALRERDSQTWAALQTWESREAQARLVEALDNEAPEVRRLVAGLDPSRVARGDVARQVRESLGRANLSPEVLQRVLARIDGVRLSPELSPDDARPVAEIPQLAPLLEKGRLFEVAQIARFDDPTAERVAADVSGPSALGDATLKNLIASGRLDQGQAIALGFAGALYQLADGEARLATAMRNAPIPHREGPAPTSTKDLAPLRAEDWEAVLAGASVQLPEGVTREHAAAVLADRFAALHPDRAFLGRLPRADQAAVTSQIQSLTPLFARNPAVVGREFSALDTAGLSPPQAEQLKAAHAQLRTLTRAYPGLRLAEVFDDAHRSPADKAATAARRVSLLARLQERLGEGELLALDYAPGSPGLARLDLDGLGATAEEQPLVLATLKAYQRSYALTRHVDDAHHLLEQGFTSAKDIATRTFPDFQAAAGFEAERARRYWTDARTTFLDSTMAVGSLVDWWAGLFNDLRVGNADPTVEDYLRQLDGYETLFGSLSYCSCQHCQSILGPAAYFVDLMKFVDDHISPQFGTWTNHPLNLATRRPDLWTLELTCANTDERIPTLDIVNEVLENAVARAGGFAGPWSDRAAVSQAVYQQALLDTANSFGQPFHLPLARIDAYLAKAETSRAVVARAVGAGTTAWAAGLLDLSPQEWRRVTQPDTDLGHLGQIYGVPFTPGAGGVPPIDAQKLIARTGLSRDELGQLVATGFVAGVTIRAGKRDANSIQNDVENVYGLTAAALDRMHRFARLRKKLPWSMAELDRVLTALGDNTLGEPALVAVARIRDIQKRLGMSVDETCGLVGALPPSPAGTSLIDRLFNPPPVVTFDGPFPKATRRFIHPALRDTAPAAADPALPRLLAGLGLDLDGLGRFVRRLAPYLATEAAGGFDPAAPHEADRYFVLSAANLSLLYRHASLARVLGLSVEELFQLIGFAGLPGRVRDLADLVQLLDLHSWWKTSGYRLDDTAVATGAPPRDAGGYPDAAALAAELVSGATDTLGFHDTIFAVALGTTEQGSRELRSANPGLFQAAGGDRWRLADGVDLNTAALVVPATVTVPVPPNGSRAVTAAEVRQVLAAYLPAEVLVRRLAAAFRIDPARTRELAALAGRDLRGQDLARALRGEGPVTPVRDLVAALRPYLVAFQAKEWDPAALQMVRQQPALVGLAATGPTVAMLRAASVYVRLAARRVGNATDAPLVDPADVRAALAAFSAATSTFAAAVDEPLARLLGVSPGLVLGLRNRVPAPGPAALALAQLAEACLLAQKLGVDGETLAALTADDYTGLARAADALRAAYGARIPNEADRSTQLGVLEEPLREGRRDALVAYLVYSSEPRPFDRPDDLYAWLLIDVQVGGCATTSRVVAAISSVQLYIHRILMDLEQDRRDPADPQHIHLRMPEAAAAEWTWRQNYRVWEANRKVFLWPENYVEPDLRDDKTPLFKELESELLQTDITDQNVLDAYTKYLTGLEEVASLTVAGAYHDVRFQGEQTIDILHLFGVTSSDPPVFYYRTCEDLIASGRDPKRAAVWGPWRKMAVQISGRRVSPVVFRGRLHVFWTHFKTKPQNQVQGGSSQFGGYIHTMSVKFTTLRPDGTWTPPQAVEMPDRGTEMPYEWHFGPGRGMICDPLWPSGPKLDDRDRTHTEPMDDYTLEGPNWDWLWLEPAGQGSQTTLELEYRNFCEYGQIDLFARRLTAVRSGTTWSLPPKMLSAKATGLYRGSPLPSIRVLNSTGMANLVIDEARVKVAAHEDKTSSTNDWYGFVIASPQQVASLSPGTEILALPGSVEDAIVQVGSDVLLLQGSVMDDNRFVARRIGTTLPQELARRLFLDGVDGILDIETQSALREAGLPLTPVGGQILDRSNAGTLDFQGPYGVYYRELFFHIPLLLANALNARGRFAAAQHWYHHVFNPTATEVVTVPPGTPPDVRARRLLDRVWRYLEFRGLDLPRLRAILTDERALAVYRKDPFNPHAIARLRPSAYQKAVVMRYVGNLLDWADHLFTQFTQESVNEALMLYVMAADVLGPRPTRLGDCGEGAVQPKTYQNIKPELGKGEPILVEVESWIQGQRLGALAPVAPAQPRLALDPSHIGHVLARFELRPIPRFPEEGGGIEPAPAAAGVPAGTQGRPAEVATAALRAPDVGLFRGPDGNGVVTGSWGPPLGGATTLGGAGLGRPSPTLGPENSPLGAPATLGGGAREVRRTQVSPGAVNIAEWVGAFGWSMLYQISPIFCVPVNKDLLAYWDRVEDRLEKIRHCKDITGQKREIALFAPEIDPRLLVRMRAAGLTLEDVLGATSGSLPPYRFLYLIDRAKAFAASLSSFGAALLSALEKKDAEEVSRLRLVHQQNLTRLTTQLRRWDIQTAEQSLAALEQQKQAAEYRRDFYQGLLTTDRNSNEQAQGTARHVASSTYVYEAEAQLLRGIQALIPQAGSPFAMKWGGVELTGSAAGFAAILKATAQAMEAVAACTGLQAGFDRRREGWTHQRDLAVRDVQLLDKQLEAAQLRVTIAERSLALHEKSIDQLDEMLELMDGKFTNLGLYTWLSTQLRRLYRDGYQNALALSRLAKEAFRFERGDDMSPGLSETYWDATHGGLLAGEQLLNDLQNLERRFLETNYRSLEVDQAFALSQVSPSALVQLREGGECIFTIPELFFDLVYPGHYKRRIKAVRLTIPCITGPYVNVSATLTLDSSSIRPAPDAELIEVPPRRSVSVATSTAQNDAGVFELSFRDERYMPFEGAGAVSTWRLTLPKTFRQFDYQTITEVILSISYTAEHDGNLRDRVESRNAELAGGVLNYLTHHAVTRLFSLRQDFSSVFTRLLHAPVGTNVSLTIDDRHFPAFLRPFLRERALQVDRAQVLLCTRDRAVPGGFQLTAHGTALANFTTPGRPGELPGQDLPPAFSASLRGAHTLAVAAAGDLAPALPGPNDATTIDPDKLLDILFWVEYRLGAALPMHP